MTVIGWIARAIIGLFMLSPWLWVASFAAVCVVATQALGRLPAFANPDPKRIAELEVLLPLSYAALLLAAWSPMVVTSYAGIHFVFRRSIGLRPAWIAAHMLGWLIMALVYFGDPIGLTDWYLD